MKKTVQFRWAVLIVCAPLALWALFILHDRLTGKSLVDRNNFSKDPENFVVSPDGRRVAYVTKVGDGVAVVLDGKAGSPYRTIQPYSLSFSPDSKHFGFSAFLGKAVYVTVVDGKEVGTSARQPLFSPDSKHVVFPDSNGVVIDGVAGKAYESYGNPIYSPDGKRLAYEAELHGYQLIVVDGKEGTFYRWGDLYDPDLAFSPDGSHIVYRAWRNGKCVMVIDGEEKPLYPGCVGYTDLTFSPDSQRMAYSVQATTGQMVILDGKAQKQYDGAGWPIVFSPDSERVAYSAKVGDKRFVVVDGQEQKSYDRLGRTLLFSPDSKRLAYIAKSGRHWLVVVDGKEGKPYDEIEAGFIGDNPAFGNDYMTPIADWLVFSPDSAHLAYCAVTGEYKNLNETAIVDEKEEKAYRGISLPAFSPDSKHLAYVARLNGANGHHSCAVTDGIEGKTYDDILIPGSIVFDSPNAFHYLVIENTSIYLVNETTK